MKNRILNLSCLTIFYTELWEEQFNKEFKNDSWSKPNDPRLNHKFFQNLTSNWQRNIALRTDYERRQALVEIDVLVSQELELTLEELKTIYRIQFPVLKQNENETFYDMNGRIVFTVSKGLVGVGLPRKAVKSETPYKIIINGEVVEEKPLGWEDIIDMKEGEIHRTIIDDTTPDGPMERTIIYKAPFAKCDREKDYEIAWEYFERINNE
jgi:DMSO/TMAO reductase YedYZ molybdopterin-dependent catalytic subunit